MVYRMFWLKRSLTLLLLLCLGCSAQSVSPSSADNDMRIKRLIRNSRHLRDDVNITLGQRKPSAYGQYDELPVTLSKGDFKKEEAYYISKDGRNLVQIMPVPDPMTG